MHSTTSAGVSGEVTPLTSPPTPLESSQDLPPKNNVATIFDDASTANPTTKNIRHGAPNAIEAESVSDNSRPYPATQSPLGMRFNPRDRGKVQWPDSSVSMATGSSSPSTVRRGMLTRSRVRVTQAVMLTEIVCP